MPNPERKLVVPIESGTADLRRGPEGSDFFLDSNDSNQLKYASVGGTIRTVANLDQAQTFTNKTLTSPTITTPTVSTSLTTPLVIGGTGTTSDLSLQTTSGVGASGADMHFLVGNAGATEAMTILNSGNVGINTTTPDTKLDIVSSALGTTSTDAVVVQNETAATGAVTVQISPRMRLRGTAWDTAASQTVDFFTEVLPATAATPTGKWQLGYSLNGAAASYPAKIGSDGVLEIAGIDAHYLTGTLNANSVSLTNIGAASLVAGGSYHVVEGIKAFISTAPTIASGFGTSPSVVANNGTAAFTVNVGTGGSASAGVITLPTATTGWIACVKNLTAVAANRADQHTVQTASTTTSITVQNQTISTGAALAWTASDILQITCVGY